jgi:hypothetical protein
MRNELSFANRTGQLRAYNLLDTVYRLLYTGPKYTAVPVRGHHARDGRVSLTLYTAAELDGRGGCPSDIT